MWFFDLHQIWGGIWDNLGFFRTKTAQRFSTFCDMSCQKAEEIYVLNMTEPSHKGHLFFFAAKTGHEFQHLQVAATTLTYYLMVKLLWFLDVSGEDFPVKTDELNSC